MHLYRILCSLINYFLRSWAYIFCYSYFHVIFVHFHHHIHSFFIGLTTFLRSARRRVSRRRFVSSVSLRERRGLQLHFDLAPPTQRTKKERYIVGFRHDSPPVLLRVVTEYVVTDGRSLVYTDAQPPYTGTFRVIFQRPGGRAARVTTPPRHKATPPITFHALCTCSLLFFSKNLQ